MAQATRPVHGECQLTPPRPLRAGTVQVPCSGKACRGAAAPTGARRPFATAARGAVGDTRTVSLELGAVQDASDLHTRASGLTD